MTWNLRFYCGSATKSHTEATDIRIYLTLSYDFSYSKFYSLLSVLLTLSLWVRIKNYTRLYQISLILYQTVSDFIHSIPDYARFHSPQEELSNQEKWQRHSPRLNLVLKVVEVLHTNTTHTVLMLAMQVAVTRATRYLQWFKLIPQNKNTFGCRYIHTYSHLHREKAKTTVICELRSTRDLVNGV